MREPLEVYGSNKMHTFVLKGRNIHVSVKYKGVEVKRARLRISADELVKWLITQMKQPAQSAEDRLREGIVTGSAKVR